jgi:hypothetical protein
MIPIADTWVAELPVALALTAITVLVDASTDEDPVDGEAWIRRSVAPLADVAADPGEATAEVALKAAPWLAVNDVPLARH